MNKSQLGNRAEKRRVRGYFIVSGLLIALLAVVDLLLGTVRIPTHDVISFIVTGKASDAVNQNILLHFRFPKLITAILAGSALSVSGLQMQTIFRNPLAGPYVLGISSGASLGVALVIMGGSALGLSFVTGPLGTIIAALIGSMLILLLIMGVSVRVRDIMTILILGMMFGMAVSAITGILQYFSNQNSLKSFVIWTMGSLGSVNGRQLWFFAGAVALGQFSALLLARPFNVMSLGENYARSLGYHVERIRLIVFISTSMLAGTTTAFTGPLAFVGIAVPHIVRMFVKTSNHAVLIPATLLFGAIFMLICDIIAQLPGFDLVIPINSVAALMGIPVVIYVIIRNKRLTTQQ